MIRVIVPFLFSIVVVLLVVGLAMRTQRGQFAWSEVVRHRKEALDAVTEAEREQPETGTGS